VVLEYSSTVIRYALSQKIGKTIILTSLGASKQKGINMLIKSGEGSIFLREENPFYLM
jgi:hypothetical protein